MKYWMDNLSINAKEMLEDSAFVIDRRTEVYDSFMWPIDRDEPVVNPQSNSLICSN